MHSIRRLMKLFLFLSFDHVRRIHFEMSHSNYIAQFKFSNAYKGAGLSHSENGVKSNFKILLVTIV